MLGPVFRQLLQVVASISHRFGARFGLDFVLISYGWNNIGIIFSNVNFASMLFDCWCIVEPSDTQNVSFFIDKQYLLAKTPSPIIDVRIQFWYIIGRHRLLHRIGIDFWLILDSILASLGRGAKRAQSSTLNPPSRAKRLPKSIGRAHFWRSGATCFQDLRRALAGTVFNRFDIDLDPMFANVDHVFRI